MAIAFVKIDTHKRALGHSVAAAFAYRTGLCLRDLRTGELHDYRDRETREEIADSAIVSARPTPLAADWQTLADAMESREKHPRAWILRDVKVGIPHELSLDQKKRLARKISEALAEYGDSVVPYALHAPSVRGDERNWHTHHMLPTRALTEDGKAFGKKLSKLDNKYSSPAEVAFIRNMIGDLINEALREAGIDVEVHMGRRIDRDADREIPGEIVQMARRHAEERVRNEVAEMSTSEVVDLAITNGDIDPHRRSEVRSARQRRRRRRSAGSHRELSTARRARTRQRNPRSTKIPTREAPRTVLRRDRVQRRREKRTAEVVQLARQRTIQRFSPGRVAAREIVDQAVANGDVTPLHSGGQTHRGRGPARSGDRPRYRRRSRTWRQRRAEEKQHQGQPRAEEGAAIAMARVEPDADAEPAPLRVWRRRTKRRPSAPQQPPQELRLVPAEDSTQEATTPGPVEPEPEADPSPEPAPTREPRRRRSRTRVRMATDADQAPTQRPARKRRRRAPRERVVLQQADEIINPGQNPGTSIDADAVLSAARPLIDTVLEGLAARKNTDGVDRKTTRDTYDKRDEELAFLEGSGFVPKADQAIQDMLRDNDVTEQGLWLGWTPGPLNPGTLRNEGAARFAARQTAMYGTQICTRAYGRDQRGRKRRRPPPLGDPYWHRYEPANRKRRRKDAIDHTVATWIAVGIGLLARIVAGIVLREIELWRQDRHRARLREKRHRDRGRGVAD